MFFFVCLWGFLIIIFICLPGYKEQTKATFILSFVFSEDPLGTTAVINPVKILSRFKNKTKQKTKPANSSRWSETMRAKADAMRKLWLISDVAGARARLKWDLKFILIFSYGTMGLSLNSTNWPVLVPSEGRSCVVGAGALMLGPCLLHI